MAKSRSFILVMLMSPVLLGDLPEGQHISLTETWNSYIIENDYHKAIIPKPNAPYVHGIIKWLYVKNSNGAW